MLFTALAIDYDGGLSKAGHLPRPVRGPLEGLRSRGVALFLVSRRTTEELRDRVGEDLDLFDAIVAENGALYALPTAPFSVPIALPPPPRLLESLEGKGIPHHRGECIVTSDARHASRILASIHETQAPFSVVYAGDKCLAVPLGVSKGRGLRQALLACRLSPFNTIAVGDAENDTELFQSCGVGVAGAWGPPEIEDAADLVVPGENIEAVAPFLAELESWRLMPPQKQSRRQLLLGHENDGGSVRLTVRGRNMLVAGDSGSGKSWVTGLIAEQLILFGYSVCVIDPEGDYRPLRSLPRVVLLGGRSSEVAAQEFVRILREPDLSLVIDLAHLSWDLKVERARAVLRALYTIRRETGTPHRIIVDEAHGILGNAPATDLVDLEIGGYLLTSYRVRDLHGDILASMETAIVTRLSDPAESGRLGGLVGFYGSAGAWRDAFTDLALGEALLLRFRPSQDPLIRRFRLAPRFTQHVRHRTKYGSVPVPENRAFLFTTQALKNRRVRHLGELAAVLAHTSSTAVREHLCRGDVSRWIRDVFQDDELASRVHQIETLYRNGAVVEVNAALAQIIEERYG